METAQTVTKHNTRIPPHNVDTERAFLGSILLLGSLKGFEKITIGSFFDSKHQQIFSVMQSLDKEGQPIDIVTMSSKSPLLDNAYLVELINLVPSSHNAEHYAKILKDKQLKRQLINLADKLLNNAYEEESNVFDVVTRLENSVKFVNQQLDSDDKTLEERRRERIEKEALTYDGDDKVVSFASVAEEIKAGDKSPRFMTNWTKLDDLLKGFKPKHLIVLSGIMKHGKTTFAMDMITKMSKQKPLLLALEEPIEELLEKFIERGEEVPHGFSPKHASIVGTDWIEMKVAEGIKKYGSEIVFIDNLDWVHPKNEKDSDNEQMSIKKSVQELKIIAKKWNICMVLIVHVTKQSKADMNPTFEDFSGSSAIGKLCDKAIIIWRETKKGKRGELDITNNTNVSVQLNRQGGVGLVKMVFDNGHYKEYDWHIQDDELDELASYNSVLKAF